jgi:hypothetical protein
MGARIACASVILRYGTTLEFYGPMSCICVSTAHAPASSGVAVMTRGETIVGFADL